MYPLSKADKKKDPAEASVVSTGISSIYYLLYWLDISYKGPCRIMVFTGNVSHISRYIYHILRIVKYIMGGSYGSR